LATTGRRTTVADAPNARAGIADCSSIGVLCRTVRVDTAFILEEIWQTDCGGSPGWPLGWCFSGSPGRPLGGCFGRRADWDWSWNRSRYNCPWRRKLTSTRRSATIADAPDSRVGIAYCSGVGVLCGTVRVHATFILVEIWQADWGWGNRKVSSCWTNAIFNVRD
jgi:hypothetical protein